ncbi:MAG TPA: hypothetical protein VNP04_29160 [Alphaproteobacteria bacterium]|nr:hypothetical protein [Alphaproteobacteria bacterium]
MANHLSDKNTRELLDETLTELTFLAKNLCPAAKVIANTQPYEDEDGRVTVFPPADLSEAEEEALEEALTEKCNEILEQTNLFILRALFDSQP